MHPDVHSSNVHDSQTVEGAVLPSADKWIKKMWSIYTMEYYSAIGKDEYLPFTLIWMELEGIMLSEISQTEKRQLSYLFTHIWNIRNSAEDHRVGREN